MTSDCSFEFFLVDVCHNCACSFMSHQAEGALQMLPVELSATTVMSAKVSMKFWSPTLVTQGVSVNKKIAE
jgi:hypothetical protein